jgi:hypothetical protein
MGAVLIRVCHRSRKRSNDILFDTQLAARVDFKPLPILRGRICAADYEELRLSGIKSKPYLLAYGCVTTLELALLKINWTVGVSPCLLHGRGTQCESHILSGLEKRIVGSIRTGAGCKQGLLQPLRRKHSTLQYISYKSSFLAQLSRKPYIDKSSPRSAAVDSSVVSQAYQQQSLYSSSYDDYTNNLASQST